MIWIIKPDKTFRDGIYLFEHVSEMRRLFYQSWGIIMVCQLMPSTCSCGRRSPLMQHSQPSARQTYSSYSSPRQIQRLWTRQCLTGSKSEYLSFPIIIFCLITTIIGTRIQFHSYSTCISQCKQIQRLFRITRWFKPFTCLSFFKNSKSLLPL